MLSQYILYAQMGVINKQSNDLFFSSLYSGVSGPLPDGRFRAVLMNRARVDVMD